MDKMLHTKALVEKASVTPSGVVTVVGSSSVLDRMGDIIDQAGWSLKNYLTNPVILWGHNVSEEKPPIGKALKVWVEDKGKATARLMFNVQFDLQDAFAADIFRKIKEGYINTVSVGFLPTQWEELEPDNWFGGRKYTDQELLELSFVPVPANPAALVQLNSFAKADKRFAPVEEKELFPQIKDNRYKKMLKDSKEVDLEKVETKLENEFTVEVKAIEEFEPTSFRALPLKEEEKDYVVILGQLKGDEAFVEQSFRYHKDSWTEAEVEAHKAQTVPAPSGTMDETGTVPVASPNAVETPGESENESGYDNETPMTSTTADMMTEVVKEVMDACTPDTMKDLKAFKALVGGTMPDPNMMVGDMNVGHVKALMADTMGTWVSNLSTTSNEDLNNQEAPKELIEIKRLLDETIKSGRVLSSKNEGKVKQAMELLAQVLSELAKDEEAAPEEGQPKAVEGEEVEEAILDKKIIPYKDLGKAPETETWDGPGEIAKADIAGLKLMCAWYDDTKADDKGSYKLPHHKGDGTHVAIWRGVAAAMGALLGARGGADIPEEDKKGVYNHLVKHYKEFEKDVPEFKAVEDQVLAGFQEEIQAITLDREEKHVVRLIKKVLDNQKQNKAVAPTGEQQTQALKIITLALSLYRETELKKGGV